MGSWSNKDYKIISLDFIEFNYININRAKKSKMIKVIKKPDKKEVTTILGKDVHEIIEKYSDKTKYQEYRKLWKEASSLKYIPEYPLQIDFELNYSCNFACEMCTWSVENTKAKGKKTWFSFDVYKEIKPYASSPKYLM